MNDDPDYMKPIYQDDLNEIWEYIRALEERIETLEQEVIE